MRTVIRLSVLLPLGHCDIASPADTAF